MSSSKEADINLPDGWIVCNSKSKDGRKYYFNKKTGKSSWTKPEVGIKFSVISKSTNVMSFAYQLVFYKHIVVCSFQCRAPCLLPYGNGSTYVSL